MGGREDLFANEEMRCQRLRVLRAKPTVKSRAFFWKIAHNTLREVICLKLGRYKESAWFGEKEEPESWIQKASRLWTMTSSRELIASLQESYEPFRQGVKAFIPLDRPFEAANADQIKALSSVPQKADLIRFILDNEVIPDDLADGLRQAKRVKAVREYRAMLDQYLVEQRWQGWCQTNSWVLGSEFVRILDERRIDTQKYLGIPDGAYDGFLDVVEIKQPGAGMQFWESALDHGKSSPQRT